MTVVLIEGEAGAYVQIIEGAERLLAERDATILHMIFVPAELRGRGLGRQLLKRTLGEYGHLPLYLAPVPEQDTPFDVVPWYERHGFEWASPSRNVMRRPPGASPPSGTLTSCLNPASPS